MISDEEKIEIENAKEEILEIVEKCNKCGLCKELDPIFRVFREEALSPRGRCILFSKKIYDPEIFDDPLSGICKQTCPFEIDIDSAIRKARKILNIRGKENEMNKNFLKRIKDKQNPFSEY